MRFPATRSEPHRGALMYFSLVRTASSSDTSSTPHFNADQAELDKFAALASRWWDPESEFKPLHAINPLRLGWIRTHVGELNEKHILDVGCGGGILAERMAQAGDRKSVV